LQISTIQEEYDSKFDYPLDVKISTITGEQYLGKLEMFSKKYLYLLSDKSVSTGGTSHSRIKILVSDVEVVILPGESNILAGLGWGALAGLVIATIVYISTNDNTNDLEGVAVASVGSLIGGLVGLLVGIASSTSDEVIEIATIRDLIKLKEYAKYNPSDKSPPGVKYFQVDSL
jgi:hypothetical protein